MNVAILGLGIVGKGVFDILKNDFDTINVKYILEIDEQKKAGIDAIFASSIEEIVEDQSIDIVIELIGGKTFAYHCIRQALIHKKHVVTANKAVISAYFEELTNLALEHGVSLLYEASVAAATILLDPLKQISKINHINTIEGIANGSTNFVLDNIFLENRTLDEAISLAFEKGYLETGSNDDMDGLDAMRKINILSMLSYQTYINEEDITLVPLSSITEEFITHVKQQNQRLKYIASSSFINNQIIIQVEPVLVSNDSLYNKINYEENIVSLYGKYHHKQSFIGQGAGRYPTASAIVYDVLSVPKQDSLLPFKNTYKVNQQEREYLYLVLYKNNEFKQIKTTNKHLLRDPKVCCFARIEEE